MPDSAGLTDPLDIGTRTAPNRVVFGPHETNLGRGRTISDRHVAYYGRRAAGGAGVVVTEEASVHPSDWPAERAPLGTECGPGWAAVAQVCHEHGSLVLAALGHAGGQGTSHWSQRELWAPSRVPEVNTREVPKWMEASDIEAVIDGFAEAAALAVEAGCDGVEVNAGQFSLVRQFLSGLTNQRSDEWADRPLFARRVLAAVRAAIGADAVLALRLSCDELAPWAGITHQDAPDVAVGLLGGTDDGDSGGNATARVDLLTVVRGSIYSAGATRPDGHEPEGFNLDLARTVRDAVVEATGGRVPVVAQGSIVEPSMAEWAISDGACDAVEMTRAQIADPDLVAKVVAGVPEQVRPCVLCNQMCSVRDNRNPIVSCIGEPASGHETTDVPVGGTSSTPLDVLVVGGGPAGLEAARVAALRGHRVRLLERDGSLGGRIPTTSRQPGRARFALLADWLEAECRRLGVELATSSDVDVVTAASDGHVIVATGGRAGDPTFGVERGCEAAVLPAADVLDDPEMLPPGAVLVWDPIGGPTGVAVAEVLATAPAVGQVHLATPDYIVGNELARSGDMGPANARLAHAGVMLHRRRVLRSVGRGHGSGRDGADGDGAGGDSAGVDVATVTAVLADRFSEVEEPLEVVAVVDAGARLPDDVLAEALHHRLGRRPLQAGDCVAPRTVHEAILEGRRAALELG